MTLIFISVNINGMIIYLINLFLR